MPPLKPTLPKVPKSSAQHGKIERITGLKDPLYGNPVSVRIHGEWPAAEREMLKDVASRNPDFKDYTQPGKGYVAYAWPGRSYNPDIEGTYVILETQNPDYPRTVILTESGLTFEIKKGAQQRDAGIYGRLLIEIAVKSGTSKRNGTASPLRTRLPKTVEDMGAADNALQKEIYELDAELGKPAASARLTAAQEKAAQVDPIAADLAKAQADLARKYPSVYGAGGTGETLGPIPIAQKFVDGERAKAGAQAPSAAEIAAAASRAELIDQSMTGATYRLPDNLFLLDKFEDGTLRLRYANGLDNESIVAKEPLSLGQAVLITEAYNGRILRLVQAADAYNERHGYISSFSSLRDRTAVPGKLPFNEILHWLDTDTSVTVDGHKIDLAKAAQAAATNPVVLDNSTSYTPVIAPRINPTTSSNNWNIGWGNQSHDVFYVGDLRDNNGGGAKAACAIQIRLPAGSGGFSDPVVNLHMASVPADSRVSQTITDVALKLHDKGLLIKNPELHLNLALSAKKTLDELKRVARANGIEISTLDQPQHYAGETLDAPVTPPVRLAANTILSRSA